MTKNAQRLSQLISTFGPGAMIDLPTRSVVVGRTRTLGHEGQRLHDDSRAAPDERLEQLLKDQGRLDPSSSLSLRTPPVISRHYEWNAARRHSACFPDVVRLRAGGDNDRGRQDASATTARALAGPRYQGAAQIRFR